MTEKMKSIMTDQNEIISKVEKLSPKAGDVLLFYVKTDEQGIPIMSMDTVQQTAKMMGEILEDKGITGLFLMDKIYLFSIDNADTVIKRLENCISYITEATNQALDIESGIFEESQVVNMEEAAQDPFKRVL